MREVEEKEDEEEERRKSETGKQIVKKRPS